MTRVICEPLNGKPQRAVTIELSDGRQYSDMIDVRSGFQRQTFRERAADQFDLLDDDLRPLDSQILREAALADQRAQAGDGKERFPLITSAQLAATDYTPRPIITDCLYAGHPGFIGGMFKTCKTLLAVDAAISIGSGLPFLNVFTIAAPMSVLYFSGEGGPSIIKDYGERVAGSKGTTERAFTLSDVSNVQWCFSVPKLESLTDLDAMVECIRDTAAEVVFIDNTTLALSGDNAGVVMKMGQIFGTAIARCAEVGATPIFVHHFKRTRATDQFAPGELADLTQAGAAEIAGQWWLLTRREAYDPDTPGQHRLWLNVGGRLGHGALHALDVQEGRLSDPGGRRWDVDVQKPEEVRQAVKDRKAQVQADREREQIDSDLTKIFRAMAFLERQHPEGNSKTTIRDRSCIRGKRFDEALAAALDAKQIEPCAFTVSNHRTPIAGYRLCSEVSHD